MLDNGHDEPNVFICYGLYAFTILARITRSSTKLTSTRDNHKVISNKYHIAYFGVPKILIDAHALTFLFFSRIKSYLCSRASVCFLY